MVQLIDKIILILCCFLVFQSKNSSFTVVLALLACIVFTALIHYTDKKKYGIFLILIYILGASIHSDFASYLPILFYDFLLIEFLPLGAAFLIPSLLLLSERSLYSFLCLILFYLLSYLLHLRSSQVEKLSQQLKTTRDNSIEMELYLNMKNKDLLEKQDYEIHMATLSERNRIAREIHDNVGHILSRSILQLGALLAINTSDHLMDPLNTLMTTLKSAMDSIRKSVHNLHDDAFNLYDEINKVLSEYTKYKIDFEFDMSDTLPKSINYCFLTTTKEALTNISKHSNGDQVQILFREHPGFYQLLIHDNGNNAKTFSIQNGMGLENMKNRVDSLKGNINFKIDNGFRIFLSIPKEQGEIK